MSDALDTPFARRQGGSEFVQSIEPNLLLRRVLVSSDSSSSRQTYEFLLPDYYSSPELLPISPFAVWVTAIDTRTEPAMSVAIKKVVNVFEQSHRFQRRFFRSLRVLMHFSSREQCHRSLLRLHDIICPGRIEEFHHVYLVFPFLEFTLEKITRANKTATERMVKYIMHQVFDGLSYLHSCGVLHRDLSPKNILINRNLDVIIGEFDLSRGVDEGCELSTTYVTSRWYRPIEYCLSWNAGTFASDIWSAGCVMAELMSRANGDHQGKVLFRGLNYLDQLRRIFSVLGLPSDLQGNLRGCEEGLAWVERSIPPTIQTTSLSEIFSHTTPGFVDLLSKCLTLDPLKRISAREALRHPWFRQELSSESPETPSPLPLDCYLSLEEEGIEIVDELETRHSVVAMENDEELKFLFRLDEDEDVDNVVNMKIAIYEAIERWICERNGVNGIDESILDEEDDDENIN